MAQLGSWEALLLLVLLLLPLLVLLPERLELLLIPQVLAHLLRQALMSLALLLLAFVQLLALMLPVLPSRCRLLQSRWPQGHAQKPPAAGMPRRGAASAGCICSSYIETGNSRQAPCPNHSKRQGPRMLKAAPLLTSSPVS